MDFERFQVSDDDFAILFREFITYVKAAAHHPGWVVSAFPGSIYMCHPDRPLVDGDVYYELSRKVVSYDTLGFRKDQYATENDWDTE